MAAPLFTLKIGDGLGAHIGSSEELFAAATMTLTSNIKDGHMVLVDGKLRTVPAVTVTLDEDGKLNGDTGIQLLAHDDSLGLDSGQRLQWNIAVRGAKQRGFTQTVRKWTIDAGEDGDIKDLADEPPVVGVSAVAQRGLTGAGVDNVELDGEDLVSYAEGVEVGRVPLAPLLPGAAWSTLAGKEVILDPDGDIITRSTKTTFYDDFTTKPNGTLVDGSVSDSGHTYSVLGQIPWAITDGRLTHTQTNTATTQSSYLGVNLGIEAGDKVGLIWVEYEVPSGSDPQESIALILSATDFTGAPDYEFANASAHAVFTENAVKDGVLRADHPGLTEMLIAGRAQYTTLTPGVYRVEITRDGTRGTLTTPDGVRHRIQSDALVDSYAGPWATLQLYALSGGARKALKVLRWGAELQRRTARGAFASPFELARVATRPPRLLGAMQTSGTGTATALTSSLSAKLYGLTVPMPASKHVLCKGLAWFDEQVPAIRSLSQLLVGVYAAGGGAFGKLTTIQSGFTPANAMTARTVTITGGTGTWTYTHGGQVTASLAWNVSAADLQTAIQGLSTVGAGKATVTLSGTTYTILFDPSVAHLPVSVVGSGGASAGTTAAYSHGRLIPWELELTPTHLGAFTVGEAIDFQVKAQANASSLFTFIDSGDASGGTSTLRRSSMEIYELP